MMKATIAIMEREILETLLKSKQNRSAPHQSTTSRIPPSTPFLNKLCRTIRESTPLRNAVFLSPTRTPARPPRPFYVQPTQQVLWRRLPQPAKDLQHENDMLREQLRLAERREIRRRSRRRWISRQGRISASRKEKRRRRKLIERKIALITGSTR
ncbi:hypothetical protein DL93DRAFT_1163496 [Clavulina sp. PMI_390]|nr:hypothetical protein DL93DRAFT_1163496 [Clavulina sp. PMI_390]